MRRFTLVGVLALALGAGVAAQDAMTALADAERAFARETAKVGIRDGFLAWFAKDAIGFRPALGNAWQQISARPKPPDPTAVHLDWEPRTGDVAASGELGWLTGPSTFTAPDGTKYYGNYLSIWKKTPEGWRVHIDVGADAPSPVAFAPGFVRMPAKDGRFAEREASRPAAASADVEVVLTALKQADAAANTATGFATALAAEARYHRPGSLPLVGKAAITAAPEPRLAAATWKALAAEQARSLDLGYTYGRFDAKTGEAASTAGAAPGGGHYVRVWRRNAAGAWQIVAQVDQPDGR
jgi:ketosteroid isomerase-like protein